jgi:protoheme IX farnesyltransferase
VAILPYSMGIAGAFTSILIALTGIGFTILSWLLLKTRTMKAASRVMFGSFIYLPVIQIAMLIDKF